MKVKVLFFGATAEVAGRRETELEFFGPASVATVSDRILDSYPNLHRHKLLLALNEQYAAPDKAVADGDELAIFTPVSGG